MRFIMQLWSDEARPASPTLVQALARFNEELAQAGVLLAAEGLVASSAGVRMTMARGERIVTHGPFRDASRLCAGFWILRASSKQHVLEWARRCPLGDGDMLELRELYGVADIALPSSELATA
jgi:hypothetical protein